MKRILATTLLALTFSLVFSPNSFGSERSQWCENFLEMEKDWSKTLPRKIDEITRLVSVAVNCDTKTIKYTKQISVDVQQLATGWQERKQRQHTQLHCNKDGLSSTVRWNAMDVIFDKDYNYVVTLMTTSRDCL